MEEEKKPPEKEIDLKLSEEEPKEVEEKSNPVLDVLENNLDIEPDSVEVKISIPFD